MYLNHPYIRTCPHTVLGFFALAEDYTIAVCPGIANSSESTYVRALVSLACSQGYRCVVLNHLGVLPHLKVTSPRVFRYG